MPQEVPVGVMTAFIELHSLFILHVREGLANEEIYSVSYRKVSSFLMYKRACLCLVKFTSCF